MRLFKYRYRPIHAICEKLIQIAAALLPKSNGRRLREAPRKVLVLKFGGMGEAVLARSLLDRLRERNPGISFDFVIENRTEEIMTGGASGTIFRYSPGTDGICKALAILREIRNRRYDAVLDFEQHSLLTAAFARASSVGIRVGFVPFSSAPRGRMFTHPIELDEKKSMWSAFIRIGQVLDPDLPRSLMTTPPLCSSAADAWLSEWWNSHVPHDAKGPVVAMHVGVGPSAQYRRWPTERFVNLANAMAKIQTDVTMVMTGAKSEQPLITDFRKGFSGRSIDASDIGGLEHTAALLRRCDLLISNDTGVMHLGAAIGCPTVGLFGASNPIWWAPVGPRATSVYPTRQTCSPCINSYLRQIPEKCTAEQNSACMWDISIDDVLNAIRVVVDEPWFDTELHPMSDSQHQLLNVLISSRNSN